MMDSRVSSGTSAAVRRVGACACTVVAATLLLAGCNLGPHYVRPDIPAPTSWTPVTTESTNTGPPRPDTTAWPDVQWWHAFNSPELDRLIGAAQQANDDVKAAVARVQQADAQVRIATAPLLPTLDAGFTPTRARQVLPMPPGNQLSVNTFPASLTAGYELDFWGRNTALRAAALAQATGSRYDRETVQLSTIVSVASTFFTVLSLRDRLTIATNDLEKERQTLKGLQFEQGVGTATALDVAQQQAAVDTEDAVVPALRAQLSHNLVALAILLGTSVENLQLRAGTLDELATPAVTTGLPAELLVRRPDVASAEAQLIAANADVRAARAAFFPTIQLTASGGVESLALSTMLEPASRIFQLSAALTQPIFEGGRLRGEYAQNKGRYEELLADYHKAVISAFDNTEDALTQVHQTAEQLLRQQRATQSARRANDFSQAQFHAGTINILTVLTTETTLLTAEDTLAQVRLANFAALVNLYQALGGGWETRQEQAP